MNMFFKMEAVDKGGLSAFGGSPPRGAGAIHLRRKAPKRACLYKPRLSGFVINLNFEKHEYVFQNKI